MRTLQRNSVRCKIDIKSKFSPQNEDKCPVLSFFNCRTFFARVYRELKLAVQIAKARGTSRLNSCDFFINSKQKSQNRKIFLNNTD